MAGNKYLEQNAGQIKEVAASNTSVGGDDANKVVALNASGKIDVSLLEATDLADAIAVTVDTGVTLSAGDNVNIYDNAGPKARLADNSNNRPVHGFVKVGYAAAQSALVHKEGTNDQLTGLTPGAVYFLGTVGATTATPPTGTGEIVQRVGIAFSATDLDFERAQTILLA